MRRGIHVAILSSTVTQAVPVASSGSWTVFAHISPGAQLLRHNCWTVYAICKGSAGQATFAVRSSPSLVCSPRAGLLRKWLGTPRYLRRLSKLRAQSILQATHPPHRFLSARLQSLLPPSRALEPDPHCDISGLTRHTFSKLQFTKPTVLMLTL